LAEVNYGGLRHAFFPFACYSLSVIRIHTNTDNSEAVHGTTENEPIYLVPDCVYS